MAKGDFGTPPHVTLDSSWARCPISHLSAGPYAEKLRLAPTGLSGGRIDRAQEPSFTMGLLNPVSPPHPDWGPDMGTKAGVNPRPSGRQWG